MYYNNEELSKVNATIKNFFEKKKFFWGGEGKHLTSGAEVQKSVEN